MPLSSSGQEPGATRSMVTGCCSPGCMVWSQLGRTPAKRCLRASWPSAGPTWQKEPGRWRMESPGPPGGVQPCELVGTPCSHAEEALHEDFRAVPAHRPPATSTDFQLHLLNCGPHRKDRDGCILGFLGHPIPGEWPSAALSSLCCVPEGARVCTCSTCVWRPEGTWYSSSGTVHLVVFIFRPETISLAVLKQPCVP